MKITVITVTFNSEKTIAQTLQSVATQTYRDIEHIIIDGASTDSTLAIVREMGTHVAHCISEPDRGIYDAMNKGLRVATGDIVGFLNGDDEFARPDSVATVVATALRSDADAVFADLEYVSGANPNRVVRHWKSGVFTPGRLRFGWMPPHPTFYVRREIIEKTGEFSDELRIAADYDFMLRALSIPGIKTAYIPSVLVKMRTGGASNGSLGAVFKKTREDLRAIRQNNAGGLFTLLCKNVRKLPQLLHRQTERSA